MATLYGYLDRARKIGAIGAMVLIGGGCASPIPSARTATRFHPSDGDPAFTVVALPDTQYYAAAHPEVFRAQTQWIVGKRDTQEIALVIHEGDIVDTNEPWQWANAWASLHVLDGVVPYVLSIGNHDYSRRGDRLTRDSLIDAYFPDIPRTRATQLEGMFEPGRIENAFQLLDAPGGPWLIVTLEFGPRDAVLTWADQILRQHESIPAIVVTHAYLRADNARYDHTAEPAEWNPHRYLDDRASGSVNDGEEIWRKLVVKNPNVLFVLCGHELGDGVGRLTSIRPDGSRVHQILANYQMGAIGGGGYLRLMRFAPAKRRVEVRTYSPFLDRFKTDPDNAFALDY